MDKKECKEQSSKNSTIELSNCRSSDGKQKLKNYQTKQHGRLRTVSDAQFRQWLGIG